MSTDPRPAVCPLCEAMCGILVQTDGATVTSVRPDPDDPLSAGAICPKAAGLIDLHADPDRLRHPLRRTATGWERCGWDEALDAIADGLNRIADAHGRDAVAVYLGNPNVHNLGMMTFGPMLWRTLRSRNRYSATSVDQLPHMLAAKRMLGHQLLMPIPDVDRTQLLWVIGANPLVSNGSLMSAPGMRRRLDALRARGGRVVVLDPRRTETAERADEHHFVRPGSDAAWLMAVLHTVLSEREPDLGHLAERVDGVARLRALSEGFTPERVAAFTGIDAATTRRLALELCDTERAAVYPRFGACTQAFGGMNLWLAGALNLVCGNLDREGGVMLPQPAFDIIRPPLGRGVGPGGEGRWRARVSGRPEFAGELPVAGLAEEILTPGDGQIRALLVWAGNPVLSTPNGAQLERALGSLELIVAVDYYLNETSRHAHYVLPPPPPLSRPHYDVAFHGLAVRNTAKWVDPVLPCDGDHRHDWEIVLGLVERIRRHRGISVRERVGQRVLRALGPEGLVDLGLRFGPNGLRSGERLSVPALRRRPHGVDLGPLRPCLLERMPAGHRIDAAPEAYAADVGRLREALDAPVAPLVLIGRRQLRGNNSWMHNLRRLVKGKPRCTLLVHPDDAAAAGVVDGGAARVRSRVGEVTAAVEVTEGIMPGVVSLPHGFGHDRPGSPALGGPGHGVALRVAAELAPGPSANDLTDERVVDEGSGNAVLNGVPVTLSPG
jgi:anaerobic selenocysteine-containing dehydrogenase